MNIRIEDLRRTLVIQPERLPLKDKELLLDTYDSLKNVQFPSLMEQFRTGYKGRAELDTAVLSVLGMESGQIEEWLPQIYKRLYDEMALTRSLRKD